MKAEEIGFSLYGDHFKKIYENIPGHLKEKNPNITFSNVFFSPIIKKLPPGAVILEVGSLYGNSAISFFHLLKSFSNHTAKIICVDTWLGSKEHSPGGVFYEHDGYSYLQLINGELWNQFRFNVVKNAAEDSIIPLRQTSTTAAKVLSKLGIKADLIYIDASHEQGDVINDIYTYLPLLKEEGIMVGDDYTWEGVKHDVDLFERREAFMVSKTNIQDARFETIY